MRQFSKLKSYYVKYDIESPTGYIPRLNTSQKFGRFRFFPISEGKRCFSVDVIVKAKDIDQAERTTIVSELTDILCLLGNYGLSCSLTGVKPVQWEIDEEGRKFLPEIFRFSIHALSVGKIEPTMLKKSIAFLNRLHKFSHAKQEVVRRALTWYNRGNCDSNAIDSFIDYWVALETLAELYDGEVESAKCTICNHVYDPKPIRGTILAFLKKLGLDYYVKDFQKLSKLRGKLLHGGRSKPTKVQVKRLQSLVKKMLKKVVVE